MKGTDIVGWVGDGAAYCLLHGRKSDHPVFASDEGWEDLVCDVPHNEPGKRLLFETLGDQFYSKPTKKRKRR